MVSREGKEEEEEEEKKNQAITRIHIGKQTQNPKKQKKNTPYVVRRVFLTLSHKSISFSFPLSPPGQLACMQLHTQVWSLNRLMPAGASHDVEMILGPHVPVG